MGPSRVNQAYHQQLPLNLQAGRACMHAFNLHSICTLRRYISTTGACGTARARFRGRALLNCRCGRAVVLVVGVDEGMVGTATVMGSPDFGKLFVACLADGWRVAAC